MSESADGRAQKPEQKTTPATPARPTITAIVQSCLDSFQNCLDQGALIHSREVSLVEDQLARFSIWAANIKALEFGRNSLDHRLREAPDIQDIVTGLLEALCAHLIKCKFSLACSLRLAPTLTRAVNSFSIDQARTSSPQ